MKQVYEDYQSGHVINIKLARWELDILVVCASTLTSSCAGVPRTPLRAPVRRKK